MKLTSYFINTARGKCVDEPALVRALQEGLIAGAGIDVTAEEPIEVNNPLIKMPNVILTGHSAFLLHKLGQGAFLQAHDTGSYGPEWRMALVWGSTQRLRKYGWKSGIARSR